MRRLPLGRRLANLAGSFIARRDPIFEKQFEALATHEGTGHRQAGHRFQRQGAGKFRPTALDPSAQRRVGVLRGDARLAGRVATPLSLFGNRVRKVCSSVQSARIFNSFGRLG